MKKYRVLYNPYAGGGKGLTESRKLCDMLPECELDFCDITGIESYDAFFASLLPDETLIISGGDGTLNRFANDIGGRALPCEMYLYRAGTGNDFLRDVTDSATGELSPLNDYLTDLPTVTINGTDTLFVNGIGYGIDGTACEVADKHRASGKTDINYTSISVKLLLNGYDCPSAKITVDGVVHTYKRVWLASAMKGRYYGGGMNAAPMQNRASGKLTCAVWHDAGRLKTLMRFPSIFKGEHTKYEKMVDFFEGDEITVEFSRPNALQIDGETVLGVTSYTARTAKAVAEAAKQTQETAKA